MVRVLLDGSHLHRRRQTGIGSYASTLATLLDRLGAEVAILLDSEARPIKGLPPVAYASQIFGNTPPRRVGRFITPIETLAKVKFGLATRLRAYKADTSTVDLASLDPPLPPHAAVYNANNFFDHASMVFAMSRRPTQIKLDTPLECAHWTAPIPVSAPAMPNIYTIHDLIPLKLPQLTLDRAGRSARVHNLIARRADHIVTVSQRSREDIMELLGVSPDRVTVTYQPLPPLCPLKQEDAEVLVSELYDVKPGEFALFCGALDPKKNIARLIEAFAIANIGLPLLLAGPEGWLADDVHRLLERLERKKNVRYLGYVSRRHITALLQTARFFVFPSLYEGFGLPVLEAMSLGLPVITSTAGALPEIAGDAARLVDPLDVPGMAQAIRMMAFDSGYRTELAEKGRTRSAYFSEALCAERLKHAYEQVGLRV